MGCANTKIIFVADALNDVAADPVQGLPNLQTALAQAAKDKNRSSASCQEDVKRAVPQIFEVLPQAMKVLSIESPKPVIAACGVIDRCVAACNDPSLAGTTVAVDVEKLKECMSSLFAWLAKAQEKAISVYRQDRFECASSSAEVLAIANAIASLFKLEEHTVACKQEMIKLGGISIALKLMQTQSSGIKMQAMQALAMMLSLFVDTQETLEAFIAGNGTYTLVPYVEDPMAYDVSKEMLGYCTAVLQTCLDNHNLKNIRNKVAVQNAIDKGAQPFESWNSMHSNARRAQ